jgi:hypothetical protein
MTADIRQVKINNCMKSSVILIICDLFHLTNSLIEGLNNSDLFIIVVSKNSNQLYEKYKNTSNILITTNTDFIRNKFAKIDYLIFISNHNNVGVYKKILSEEMQNFKKIVNKFKPKSLFVMFGMSNASEKVKFYGDFENSFKSLKTDSALVFYGDLLSVSGSSKKLSNLSDVLLSVASGKNIKVSTRQIYYPLLEDDLAFYILHLLFSMKAYGVTTFIVGRPLTTNTLQKIIGSNKLTVSDEIVQYETLPYDEKITSKKLSKKIVTEVYEKIKTGKLKNNYSKSKLSINEIVSGFIFKLTIILKMKEVFSSYIRKLIFKIKNIFLYHKIKILISVIFLIFFIPFYFILCSLGLLYVSKTAFENDYIKVSLKSAKTSLALSQNNYKYTFILKETPLMGDYFRFFIKPSEVLVLQSEAVIKSLEIFGSFYEMLSGEFFKKDTDFEKSTQKIIFDLETLYQKLGFLESEINGNNNIGVEIVSSFLKDTDLVLVRQKLLFLAKITERLPILLGKDKPTKYSLVFQNNSILRPTGGIIESLSLVGFSGLRITGITVEDVSSVDKALSVKVKPPGALENYFGEDSWFLRDSNWDPDFPSSALQTAFFLDKGLNVSLDGTIVFDKDVIYEFINILNGRGLTKNLDDLIYEDGIRENYPEESEEFTLTKLLKHAFTKYYAFNDRKKSKILKVIISGLNNRKIQIFVKDVETQRNIAGLDWDGAFAKKKCAKPCFSDFVSLIESTKKGSSPDVVREAQLSILFQEGIIKRKLTYYLENNNYNDYQAYIRLFTNADVGFSPVNLVSDNENKTISPEIISARGLKEAGVFVEIKPDQTLALVFAWEGASPHNFNQKEEYELYWRKQSGVGQYPVEIVVFLPEGANVLTDPVFSLTDRGVFRYNTSLDRDFSSRIFW